MGLPPSWHVRSQPQGTGCRLPSLAEPCWDWVASACIGTQRGRIPHASWGLRKSKVTAGGQSCPGAPWSLNTPSHGAPRSGPRVRACAGARALPPECPGLLPQSAHTGRSRSTGMALLVQSRSLRPRSVQSRAPSREGPSCLSSWGLQCPLACVRITPISASVFKRAFLNSCPSLCFLIRTRVRGCGSVVALPSMALPTGSRAAGAAGSGAPQDDALTSCLQRPAPEEPTQRPSGQQAWRTLATPVPFLSPPPTVGTAFQVLPVTGQSLSVLLAPQASPDVPPGWTWPHTQAQWESLAWGPVRWVLEHGQRAAAAVFALSPAGGWPGCARGGLVCRPLTWVTRDLCPIAGLSCPVCQVRAWSALGSPG